MKNQNEINIKPLNEEIIEKNSNKKDTNKFIADEFDMMKKPDKKKKQNEENSIFTSKLIYYLYFYFYFKKLK